MLAATDVDLAGTIRAVTIFSTSVLKATTAIC